MSDEAERLSVRVLQGIRRDLRDLRGDVSGLRGEMSGLRGEVNGLREDVNARFSALEQATIAGFTGVHQRLERLDTRLEGIRDLAGEHWRDHEARIRRLEDHTGLG